MQTMTVKLEPGEYTNFREEFNNHDLIIFSGARGAGKSYPVAKHVSSILEGDEDAKFMYMRIQNPELATYEGWCSDLNLSTIADGCDRTILSRGKPTRGDIKLSGQDDEGMTVFERVIGKCVSLESSHQFKSGKYDEYKAIVFEEYTHLDMNPRIEERYVFNFIDNVISVFRERPKKIYLLCNALKSIPLLDQTIDELTGEIFMNPLKIRIFRKGPPGGKQSKYLAYKNGELFVPDEFKVKIHEFYVLYTNKDYIIMQSKIYPRKHYIQYNKDGKKKLYHPDDYLQLKYFCQNSANNEFYYQSPALERQFTENFKMLVEEIASYTALNGSRHIMD